MTVETQGADRKALQALRNLLERPPANQPVGVHLAAALDDRLTYEWLLMSDKLGEKFAGIAAGALEKLRERDREGPLVALPFSALAAGLPAQIEYLELADPQAAPVQAQLAPFLKRELHPNFAFDKVFMNALRFYVISLGDPPLHAFRLLSPKMELARSRRFGMIGGPGGICDLLEEHVLLFDTSVDCLLWDNRLYILNRQPFEQMFRYFEVSRRKVQETLETLEKVAPIVNFEEFRTQARGSAREQKLQSIAERAYVREGRPLDWGRILEVIQTFDLKVRIVAGPEGEKRLLYDAAVPWEMYNLLDDDYLISQMTSQGYEVMAKRLHRLSREMAVVPRAELERLRAAAAPQRVPNPMPVAS